MTVRPIPEGFHTATCYLTVDGAAQAIEFYKAAFGATEMMRMPMPDGNLGHAEIRIGDSPIMLSDEFEAVGKRAPTTLGGATASITLYVENADEVFQRAVKAGAKEVRPVEDQFYGDRCGTLEDPFGHQWTISTHIEEVSEEEMQKRLAAMMSGHG